VWASIDSWSACEAGVFSGRRQMCPNNEWRLSAIRDGISGSFASVMAWTVVLSTYGSMPKPGATYGCSRNLAETNPNRAVSHFRGSFGAVTEAVAEIRSASNLSQVFCAVNQVLLCQFPNNGSVSQQPWQRYQQLQDGFQLTCVRSP